MQLWLVVLILMSLSGCASLSERECLEADATSWERIGYEDGFNGYHPDRRLNQHSEACGELGVLPQRETYMAGWSRGVREYCLPERAYQVGLSGSRGNPGICPDGTDFLFRENVELGLLIHELRREMDSVYHEIEDLERKLDDSKLDKRARRDLRDRIRYRDDQLSDLRWRLMEAQSAPLIRF